MARPETEAKILQALEDTILEQGMKGLGINAVGKRAGVSTELIYRYFDGLPGLLLTWMQQQDFWTQHGPERSATDYKYESASDMIEAMLHGQVAALRTNPVLAEIRRWELIEPTESGRALAERREKIARSFADRLDQLVPDADLPAHIGLMLAGVLYLSLRAKTEDVFLGIPIAKDEGWDRIWQAVRQQLAALPGDLQTQTLTSLEQTSRQQETLTSDREVKR